MRHLELPRPRCNLKCDFHEEKSFLRKNSEWPTFYSRFIAKARPNPRNFREMFTNFAQNFPMVQNGINFAKKMPNFAYFVNKIYPEIPSNRRLQGPPGRTGSLARGSYNFRKRSLCRSFLLRAAVLALTWLPGALKHQCLAPFTEVALPSNSGSGPVSNNRCVCWGY